jgi:O-antigen/teichoic acid export membrane protein
MAKAKEMLKGLAGYSIVPIVSGLITILVIPVVSHVFPEDEYGKINLFYSMGTLLMTACMLGLDSSQIRYYFEAPKGLTKCSVRTIAIIVGLGVDLLFVALAVLLFPQQVSQYFFGELNLPLIACLGVFIASLIVFRVVNTDARMEGEVVRYNAQVILQNFITKISFVAVGLLFTTRYDASIVAMTVIMAFASCWLVFKRRAGFTFKGSTVTLGAIRTLLAFGIPMMMTTFVLNLNGMVGKIALSGAGLYAAVGVFAMATTISNVFTIIPTAFTTYWSPFMYNHYETEQDTIKRVHDLVMWGSAAIVALIIAFQNILFLIVGGGYAACQAYFMLVMTNPIQALICETTGYGIVLKEKPIYNVIASAAGVVISVIVTFALMDSYGVFAAAFGVAASSFVIGIMRTVIGQHYYKSVSHPARTAFTAVLILAACAFNIALCQSIAMEVAAGALLLAVATFAYRKELGYLWHSLMKGRS